MLEDTCALCHSKDTITHPFFIDCTRLTFFWESRPKWWENIIDFNIREEDHIYKAMLFGFPATSDDVIVITYCILHAK